MSRLEVELSDGGSYAIEVVSDGLSGLGAALSAVLGADERVHLVTNPVVGALYLEDALDSLRGAGVEVVTHQVPDGEDLKTTQTWGSLVEDLLAARITRADVVVALGGGVTGDIVGFAAAAVLRGVRCVQVPTTLLAMVDSAVGGKTGVNSSQGKNLVGAFHQPAFVYMALDVLSTLDEAEWRCGLGEVIKHGLIADQELFELCEAQAEAILRREPEVVAELVLKSCAVKASVVGKDEKENGWRRILNYGHTVGHAVETALGHGRLRHGECVAVGMLAETAWAVDNGHCSDQVYRRLDRLLSRLQMCRSVPSVRAGSLKEAVKVDKKRVGGTILTAMPVRIGEVRLCRLPMSQVLEMLDRLSVDVEE